MRLQKNSGVVCWFAVLRKFAGCLQSIPNAVTPAPFRLLQMGSAFWQSRLLYLAAKLDIATVLGGQRLSAEEIATRVGARPDAVYRLLRLLTAMGVFEEDASCLFLNNALSEPLCAGSARSVRAMILMHNSEAMAKPWYEQLEPCVREGGVPFERTHGEALYDYMQSHREFALLFSQAMDNVEALGGDSFARDFDWGRFGRIVDVGGSKGCKSIAILKRHAHLQALVMDRAEIVGEAAEYWAKREMPALLARVRFQAGDLFEALPKARSAKDIYLLSAVLHGFDDETCINVLRILGGAIGATGASVAVMEIVVPENGAGVFEAGVDMQMFMGTRGRERTLGEWLHLFDAGRMVLVEEVKLRSFATIMVLKGKPR